jgi:hypothetical protein
MELKARADYERCNGHTIAVAITKKFCELINAMNRCALWSLLGSDRGEVKSC